LKGHNIMNRRFIALAAMAAVTSPAIAAGTGPVSALEALAANAVYISGSAVANSIIEGSMRSSGCDPSTMTIWTGPSVTVSVASGSGVTYSVTGAIGKVYACRALPINSWGLANGTIVVVNKRDLLGSGYGVFPVAYNTPIGFTDLSTCATTTVPCTGTLSHTPDAGISDLEPNIFNSPTTKPTDFATALGVSNSDFASPPKAIFNQVYGLAVTPKLAVDMIAAGNYLVVNGVKVPSMSTAQVANLLSTNAKIQAWHGMATAGNATTGVNVCMREIGAGTKNAFIALFGGGLQPITYVTGTSSVPTDASGKVWVSETFSDNAVAACLTTVSGLTKGFGYGILSLASAPPANGVYVFVAIGGLPPTRDSAKVGKYNGWAQTTMQLNKLFTVANGAVPSAVAFLTKLQSQLALVDNLDLTGQVGVDGLFALATADAKVATLKCTTYPTASSAAALNPSATAAAIAAGTYPAIGDLLATWAAGNVNHYTVADARCPRFARPVSTNAPIFVK
jgi:hypothetical protein